MTIRVPERIVRGKHQWAKSVKLKRNECNTRVGETACWSDMMGNEMYSR